MASNEGDADGVGVGPAATGVVLAGGESTRFAGADKVLATVEGEPMLARVVTALRAATRRPPLVAVRTDEQREAYAAVVPETVSFVRDVPTRSGPLAGLAAAAEDVRTPWLFVVGADMPALSPTAVRWVLARAGSADAVVPVADGRLQTLHAGYRREAVLGVLDSLPEGASLQALVDSLASSRTLAVEDVPPAVPLETSLANVNTQAELDAVRRQLDDSSDPA